MKKIMNMKLVGQKLRFRDGDRLTVSEVTVGSDGCCELPDQVADMLLNTPGWSEPPSRQPRKAAKPPEKAPEKAPEPEPEPEPAEPEEEPESGSQAEEEPESGSQAEEEAGEEAEAEEQPEVPPYSEWDYADLAAEARKRMDEDPSFSPPDSKKKGDIIKALEADDAREGA